MLTPLELARLSYSPSILEAAIGMATINSLLEVDEDACIEINAAEVIMEHLLSLCNPKAYIIALGDTTPMSTILFDHGLDAISGTRVYDANLALRCVSQGANFRQIKGVKQLTLMKHKG